MKKIKLLLLSALFLGLLISCEDDKKDALVIESEVLAGYLESAESPLGKDYVNSDMPSIIKASEVKTLNEAGDV